MVWPHLDKSSEFAFTALTHKHHNSDGSLSGSTLQAGAEKRHLSTHLCPTTVTSPLSPPFKKHLGQ